MASEEFVGLRIAVYARFSDEGQSESSIEDQVRRCRDFIAARSGVFRGDWVFSDRAESGAGTDRSGYERLMRLATNKPRSVDVIVIEDLSRLSRSAADLFTAQRLLEFSEVRLVGVADGIDTFAKHSTLTFGLKSLVASIYLEDVRDKTLRGLEGRALADRATGASLLGIPSRKKSDRMARDSGPRLRFAKNKRRSFVAYSQCTSRDIPLRQLLGC